MINNFENNGITTITVKKHVVLVWAKSDKEVDMLDYFKKYARSKPDNTQALNEDHNMKRLKHPMLNRDADRQGEVQDGKGL
eukprot:10231926-Ditylum_brightwellii.AAC.1